MTDLPPIDPVEALMVTVGLKAIISREVERFRKSDLKEAVELPKEISKLASDMVNGELAAGRSSAFDYKRLLKDLAAGWDPEQVEEMMSRFPPEIGQHTTGLVVRSKAVIDALQQDYPQTNYVTATGSINLVPADKKIFKFNVVLEALCDPLSVFSMMASGGILPTQVAIVRKVFPTLSAAIDAAILDATVKAKADKKSFELRPLTEIGVRRWYGKGPLEDGMLKKSQDAVARTNAKNAASAVPPANMPQAEQTKAQRVEANS